MKRLPLTSVALNMPASGLLQAKRAFVRVLLSVAASFRVTVSVNRDSPWEQLMCDVDDDKLVWLANSCVTTQYAVTYGMHIAQVWQPCQSPRSK